MTTASSITIRYDGTDITTDCMFEHCSFEQNAAAVPGMFNIRVKDLDRTRDFKPGKEVTLTLDGQKLFGGVVMQVRRLFAFPVVDTSVLANVQERIWELSGADYNIYLDKLVLRNPNNYKRAIEVNRAYDGQIIGGMGAYFDNPGINLTTHVHNILMMGNLKTGKWAYPTQGATWRSVLEDMRRWTGATYWVDADKNLHWEPVGMITNSWGLTDSPARYPANQMIPCREVTALQDGSGMVTDALIWSGNKIYADSDAYVEDGSGLFFARFPEPPANQESREGEVVWTRDQEERAIDKQNTWGRWQIAEQNFGSGNSPRLGAIRARTLVLGPGGTVPGTGVDGGLGQPLWDLTATWFGHDVPGQNHLPAGYLTNLIFWGLGSSTSPLVQYLPCRHVSISFPTIPESPSGNETYVKFTGRFGTSYSDHRKLWRALKKGRRNITAYASSSAVASKFSTIEAADPTATPTTGSFGQLPASIDPVITDRTTYETSHAYIPGTLRVYLNGLYQRPGIEYYESTPGEGEITFYAPLLETDEVFIEFRAAGDSVE
jgi:hypothetical protein